MKFKSNIAILLSFLTFVNYLQIHNPVSIYADNSIINNSVINSQKEILNSYFNKKMDIPTATILHDTYHNLYLEYINNNDLTNALDCINNQLIYAEYLEYDIQSILYSIENLISLPKLYVKSQKTSDQLYFAENLEPLDNKKFIGISSNNNNNNNNNMPEVTHNQMATIDASFNFNINSETYINNNSEFKTIFDNKYADFNNYSSAYVNLDLNGNTTELLNNLNNNMYSSYFIENLSYLNSLDKNIFINISFSNIASIDPISFKDTYKYLDTMLNTYAPDVSLIYSYIMDEKYQPDEQYIDWISVPLTIDNNTNSDIYSLLSTTMQNIKNINSLDKPIIINNLTFNNFNSDYDITSKINELYSICDLFFPEIKGVLFNNKTGLFNNNLQSIYDTYCLEQSIYNFGTFINAQNYSYDSSYNNNSNILEFSSICSDLLDSNNLIGENININYNLNNNNIYTTSEKYYKYDLDINLLNIGDNNLTINFTGDNSYDKTLIYNINKSDTNLITITNLLDINSYINDSSSNNASTDFVRPSSYQLDVKNILQNPELPTGCEITALTIVLNYLNYNVSKTTMAKDFMARGPIGTTHPNDAFIGNPEYKAAYGCYSPVIVEAANKYFESVGSTHEAYNLTGTSFEELTEYVAKGYPVIIWGTMSMIPSYKTTKWVINGEVYYWLANEHCLVLTGYDDATSTYTIADPLRGVVNYSKSVVETRYKEIGNQAVIISYIEPSLI